MLTDDGIQISHWGRVTHICVSKLTIIGSDNGLSPGRRQAVIWTNAGVLLIWPIGTNFSESLIGIQTCSLKKMHLNMSSAKWRPFCLGLNVITAPPSAARNAVAWSFGMNPNFIVRRAGLMRSQQDFEWWWSVPLSSASLYESFLLFFWFVFIHHNFQFYFELCTYCNILDIYL